MIGELNDAAGNPVLTVLELQPTGKDGRLLNLNIVASAYGKSSNVKNFIQNSEVLYLNEDAKRTENWMQCRGLQLPLSTSVLGSIGSITYQNGTVNISGTPWAQLSLDDEAADTVEEGSGTEGKYSKEKPNLVAEWLARDYRKIFGKYGLEIEVRYDLPTGAGAPRGWNAGGKIVLNGQLGDTTVDGVFMSAQDILVYVLSHEVGHSAQGNTRAGYESQTDAIIEMYRDLHPRFTDEQLEERVSKEISKNRNFARRAELSGEDVGFKASDFTRQDAMEEVACNMLGEMMVEYNVLSKMLPKHQTIIQRAQSRVSDVLKNIRKLKPKASKPGQISIAKAYELAAEGIEQTLTDALETVQGTKNPATEGGRRYSFAEQNIPTYEDLIAKPDIEIVDVRSEAVGAVTEPYNEIMHTYPDSDEAKELYSSVIINADTGERVFVTKKTFSHSFSNLKESEIVNALLSAKRLRKIIETAVLTHSEPSNNERDHVDQVYTLFAVARTDLGLQPIKLKVKDTRIEGQPLPEPVRPFVQSENKTFAHAYDSRALVLESVEKEESPGSVGSESAKTAETEDYPVTLSTIRVAELYNLVNDKYKKYLPKRPTNTQYSLPDDPDTVVYNRTAILKEETIDRYLQDYAARGTPNYAQAYIAYMDPDDFLYLTTSTSGRYKIEDESRPLNEEEFAEYTSQQVPIQLRINHETGEVEGHEGRHRCVALRDAGIEKVPVLMFDSSNKYGKESINILKLTGQFNRYAQSYVHDMIPLSYGNRDEVIQKFGTQPSSERFYERYSGNRTLRYSVSDTEGIDEQENTWYNDIGGGDNYARTDEFRELQAESLGMPEAELSAFRAGRQKLDGELRRRLSGVLQRQVAALRGGNRNGDGLLTLSSRGTQFNIYERADGSLFHDCFEIARQYLENGELVDLHSIKTTEDGIGYDDCYNYLSEDGLCGFSITPDGDLISVYNATGKSGFLRAIAPIVKERAQTLDCYNSAKQPLSAMYQTVFGYKAASVMDYNMEYDHDNIAANHGMPQVAFMVNTPAEVVTKHFNGDQYDEAVEYRNSFVDRTAAERQYSISDDELDYLMNDFGDIPESFFDRFNGETYDSGTPYVSYDASQRMARDLLSAYGSTADAADIAAKYRQLSTLAEPIYRWALNGMRGDFRLDIEVTVAQNNIRPLAREMADIVIDSAVASEQSNEEVREYLRDTLSQSIYIADADKADTARAMGYETWGELRKARFGVLDNTTSDPKKGVEVSDIYEAIMRDFPGAVRGVAAEQAGQLAEIVEAYDKAREARDSEYNPLAADREAYRQEIAERINDELFNKAVDYASEKYNQELAVEKAKARRLERQAKEAEKKAAEAETKGAEPELVEQYKAEAEELKTEAEDARLMGQTDSETIAEGMKEGGYTPKSQMELWAEEANARDGKELTAQERMDQIVAEILRRNSKPKETKITRTYSNTLVGGGYISAAEQGIEGLRAEDAEYPVTTEKESLQEATSRLDKNYLHWYETLPGKQDWSGKDLDTAMLIFGQVQSESAASGDYSESIRWAKLIQERGHQGGQFLQALGKWTKTTIGQVIEKTQDLDERYINEKGDNAALDKLRKQNIKDGKQLDQLVIDNETLDAE